MADGTFARAAWRTFLPCCVLGLWLGSIVWNFTVFSHARRREASGHTTGGKHSGIAVILLLGALVVWLPGSFYLYQLDDRVQAAVAGGKPSDVQTEARWLIRLARLYPLNWAHGNAIHHGHVALGLVALEHDDIAAAREHLTSAGRTPGSPQLDTFGPNMALAKALLDHGERDVVLGYFDACRGFWRMDNGDLDTWSATVRAGETPDFGANLVF